MGSDAAYHASNEHHIAPPNIGDISAHSGSITAPQASYKHNNRTSGTYSAISTHSATNGAIRCVSRILATLGTIGCIRGKNIAQNLPHRIYPGCWKFYSGLHSKQGNPAPNGPLGGFSRVIPCGRPQEASTMPPRSAAMHYARSRAI